MTSETELPADSARPAEPVAGLPPVEATAGSVLFKNEIEISYTSRLPHFDRGPVRAYAARSLRGNAANTHFALVCEPSLVPRSRSVSKAASIINPGMMRLVGAGVVFWEPVKAERYVLVYENTMGVPLMTAANMAGLGWKPERVIATIVKPMISVLQDMRDRGLVHGNICPSNMFISGSAGNERVILGDCLATPPGTLQPVLFEPVERALTDPIARGQGSYEDDLYAFGVSLTVIMRSRDPLEGMTDDDVIREKMEMSSYAALTGKDRFTGGILELLRGLLYDDHNQRWTLAEIEAWNEGQRLSPKQAQRKFKAPRPVHFNNERYFRPAQLAMDLPKNPTEAVQLVDSDTLGQWVARSLEDKDIVARLDAAIESAQENGRGPGYPDRLIGRVSVALDPEAPIRYAQMRFHPEGFPSVMAEHFVTKKPLNPIADILNQSLVLFWLHNQNDTRLDVGGLISRYDGSRSFLRQTALGYGIERCLYFLCPEVHCLSDSLKNYWVASPEDLLRAYEHMSASKDRPELFIDRHIAAFLSVKERRMIDPYLQELNAAEPFKKLLANLKTLATIQKRSNMEMFPGITRWIADIIGPVYERYHDRELREKLAQKVDKLKESGDISRMVALIDNIETIQGDMNDFRKAMREYQDLREEHATLERKMSKADSYGRDTGREVAAIFSGVLAGILMLAFAFLFFTRGGPF